ncbi:MAG: hypothetical protein GOU99_03935 [Candidatus Altiarchaeota archaeon]|nr:hypothetical protein [Candidatus Altiarchaeota archaeon]
MGLIEDIAEKAGKQKDELWELVEAKRKELDYLVSEEGAAHIVASELGINLSPRVRISNIKPSMDELDIFLKVLEVNEPREWEKSGRKGKVRNLVCGDETGRVTVSLWDEMTRIEIKANDIIKISGGSVKQGNDLLEIRLGRRARVAINPKEEIPGLKSVGKRRAGNSYAAFESKNLADAKPGNNICVRAALSRLFEREPFFQTPDGRELIITGMIDDGSEEIRAVFFRQNAGKLMDLNKSGAIKIFERDGLDELMDRIELGKEWTLCGKIKQNEFFNTAEMIVEKIDEVDLEEEIRTRLEKIMGF